MAPGFKSPTGKVLRGVGSGLVGLYLKKQVPEGGLLHEGRRDKGGGRPTRGDPDSGRLSGRLEQGASSRGRTHGKASNLQESEAGSARSLWIQPRLGFGL